jgi:AcrR family transcriptional regulator
MSNPEPAHKVLDSTRSTDRPRTHAGATEAETAIFAATEMLLAEVPLHDLTVAEIISEAQISRATFYFYFSSKQAVVIGLLSRVMDDIYDVVQPFLRRQDEVPVEEALRESLERSVAVWTSHRALLMTVVETWHGVPELQELWLSVVRRFAEGVADEIDRERAAGTAPAGVDSRQLANMLIWSTERCLYVAGLGVGGDVTNEHDVVEPLLALWLGAIFGPGNMGATHPTSSAASRPKRKRTRRAQV